MIPFYIQYLQGCQLPNIVRKGCQLVVMEIQNLDGGEAQEAARLGQQGGEMVCVDDQHLFL